MIVKLQRPLGAPPGEEPKFLLYDEHKTFLHLVDVNSDDGGTLCAYFDHPDDAPMPFKVYIEADIDAGGVLHLGKLVDPQEW